MKKVLLAALVLAPAAALAGRGGSVVGSKHDLSVSGPGPVRAVSELNPCVFCHVPHAGITSRPDPQAPHRPYESSTMAARPGSPTGASRVCLSCHDGTIAVGRTKTRRIEMTIDTIPSNRPSNLGTDLRGSHPISFVPVPGSATRRPPSTDPVHLDRGGEVQCTSCHDPHAEFGDPRIGKFLVKPAGRSQLCLSCHDPATVEQAGSSHAVAAASFGEAQGNALHFDSVAEAGCLACHQSHGADPGGRLVRRPAGGDDGLCLRCHASSVTRVNIGRDLTKPSAHVTDHGSDRVHDAAEGRKGASARLPETSPGAPRHVVCVDCHDPHAASDRPAVGGVSGALAGVWGIGEDGQRVEQVRFEYELCFKCHGDSANKPQGRGPGGPDEPRRAVVEANLRVVFSASSPSSHPVVAAGKNPDVPSLRPPWTPTSVVACGDCHSSDSGPGAGGAGARGPHGSMYPKLLERSYETRAGSLESPSAYALCYKCHDRDVLLSDKSAFPLHRLHVADVGGVRRVNAPCSACHDAHGISSQAGTPTENAHLMSFDLGIVKPAPGGPPRYRSAGPRSGSCTLTCHDAQGQKKEHTDWSYSPATPPSGASARIR